MQTKDTLMKMGAMFLGVLSLLVVVMIFSEVRAYRFIGSDDSRVATITVNGQAEKMVAPDVAEISVGVVAEAKDVKTAQNEATKKNNAVIDYLKSAGVAEKDIKSSYALYPQYGQNRSCPRVISTTEMYVPCVDGPSTIVGYQARYTLQVVVRDLAKVGEILAGVGNLGANEISGPYFTVENEEVHKADVRAEAIADAEVKAERLAKDLGVKIVRVVDFNEAGGPIYFGKTMANEAYGMGGDSLVPNIQAGENEIVSSVNITYEVR